MRILGLDPAKIIGWSVIEDDKIIDFGTIQNDGFTLPQRLNFYNREITRLVDNLKPDYCAVEDLILAISGAKTLAFLGRINGVCIQSTYNKLKENVRIYTPSYWKTHSIPNITTTSPKWKVQLETCRFFGIELHGDYDKFDALEKIKMDEFQQLKDEQAERKINIDKLKSSVNRKRNPLSDDEKKEVKNKINLLHTKYIAGKTDIKNLKKRIDKELSTIGNDIYAQTGIANDIADSLCMAVCLRNEISEEYNGKPKNKS